MEKDIDLVKKALYQGASQRTKSIAYQALDGIALRLRAVEQRSDDALYTEVVKLRGRVSIAEDIADRAKQWREKYLDLVKRHSDTKRQFKTDRQRRTRELRAEAQAAYERGEPAGVGGSTSAADARATIAELKSKRMSAVVVAARTVLKFVTQKNMWFVCFDSLERTLTELDCEHPMTIAGRSQHEQDELRQAISILSVRLERKGDVQRQAGVDWCKRLSQHLDSGCSPARAAAQVVMDGG